MSLMIAFQSLLFKKIYFFSLCHLDFDYQGKYIDMYYVKGVYTEEYS